MPTPLVVKISFNNNFEDQLIYPVEKRLFEMLLMNLISNAFRYNDKKEKLLDISFQKESKTLHLFFKDNGIGLHSKYKKRIFKKFYQVGKAEDCTAKGTGLGLYLVQQIAKIHGGKIKVESLGKGSGTTFILSLPFPSKERII